ncbi:RloB family protein [Fusobacterium polymorphum]|uniref:RloB family protein n=1 Tax=Fusobacterium nucleatum subsp. polymorphum TaxID=76857 RepID=UPI0030CCAFF2
MKRTNRLNEKRSERKKVLLKSGAYLIVTDAEKTEKNYFEGIKNIIPDNLKNDLQIKIYSNKALSKIIDFAAEERNKDERFRDIWLVFDRDEVKNFDKLIEEAKENKMNVGWSNPCFEIWLMSYFQSPKNIEESQKCCETFEKIFKENTGKKYKKSEEKIYNILCENGDENKAIERAREKYHQVRKDYSQPSKMIGCTTVYKLVEELKKKIGKE